MTATKRIDCPICHGRSWQEDKEGYKHDCDECCGAGWVEAPKPRPVVEVKTTPSETPLSEMTPEWVKEKVKVASNDPAFTTGYRLSVDDIKQALAAEIGCASAAEYKRIRNLQLDADGPPLDEIDLLKLEAWRWAGAAFAALEDPDESL